jgi:UDP-2,3-diacylglucosamine pyrophosphatase LpxH
MKKYRSIFISDVHLGTKSCKAAELHNFLDNNTCNTLYLVGDIIDGWKVQKNAWRWNKKQTSVVRKILKISSTKTKVIFIPGNHDEFLRPMLNQLSFNGLELHNQYEHVGVDGKRYLVTHGDLFDGITRLSPWLSFLGDSLYDVVLGINNTFNTIRHRLGFGYWSLSKYLKYRVKKAIDFVFQFEKNLADYAKRKGFDGTICGHIHHAEIKDIDGIIYMNDGDWCESCSALVEDHDGNFIVLQLMDGLMKGTHVRVWQNGQILTGEPAHQWCALNGIYAECSADSI